MKHDCFQQVYDSSFVVYLELGRGAHRSMTRSNEPNHNHHCLYTRQAHSPPCKEEMCSLG